mmetsp:Transcript_80765/g.179461  ORF Transcript_80765/g.179461 Transcript_80765/m.179461 type:complete len:205 (-) Transcript_80765:583-1197(-)
MHSLWSTCTVSSALPPQHPLRSSVAHTAARRCTLTLTRVVALRHSGGCSMPSKSCQVRMAEPGTTRRGAAARANNGGSSSRISERNTRLNTSQKRSSSSGSSGSSSRRQHRQRHQRRQQEALRRQERQHTLQIRHHRHASSHLEFQPAVPPEARVRLRRSHRRRHRRRPSEGARRSRPMVTAMPTLRRPAIHASVVLGRSCPKY